MSQTNHIISILKEAKEQQKPYPQTFETLKNAGVTEYNVSWEDNNYKAVYSGNFGTVQEPAPVGFEPVIVAKYCDLEAAKQALREVQQKKITYVDWVTKMAAAGISHYHVDMNQRTVTYYNPSETESFTEQVPPVTK